MIEYTRRSSLSSSNSNTSSGSNGASDSQGYPPSYRQRAFRAVRRSVRLVLGLLILYDALSGEPESGRTCIDFRELPGSGRPSFRSISGLGLSLASVPEAPYLLYDREFQREKLYSIGGRSPSFRNILVEPDLIRKRAWKNSSGFFQKLPELPDSGSTRLLADDIPPS